MYAVIQASGKLEYWWPIRVVSPRGARVRIISGVASEAMDHNPASPPSLIYRTEATKKPRIPRASGVRPGMSAQQRPRCPPQLHPVALPVVQQPSPYRRLREGRRRSELL